MIARLQSPIIFLDMDGVLADFITAALKLHFGKAWRKVMDAWPKGVYETYKHMGLTVETFWDKINAAGTEFWANLPLFEWTEDLIEVCRSFGSICLLSAPSQHVSCVHGKLQWIQRVLGKKFRDFVLTPRQHKQLLAAPGRYLVEDSEQNAAEFMEAGGSGTIIIPQPWNSRPETAVPVADLVEKKLETILWRGR